MLFSEFANIMYKHCGSSYKPHEYFLFLFDTIMRKPSTPDEIKKSADDKYNPFGKLVPDTLDRLFKGTNPLNQKKIHTVIERKDSDNFAKYVDSLSWENQRAIDSEFKKRISDFNADDNLGYACADLFLQIMDDIYDGHELSSPIMIAGAVSTPKLHTIPSTSVYYDEADGKLHIGDIEIAIPKELEPPDDIAPEEEIYVHELLAAYADSLKKNAVSKDELDSLPRKYKRNFSDQRINYYSAVRIDRFVRESITNGDEQADKWKSGIFDYIKATLWDDYDDGYRRLIAVMKKVVDSTSTSVVDDFHQLVGAKEKEGVCHLLANDGTIHWVDDDEQ